MIREMNGKRMGMKRRILLERILKNMGLSKPEKDTDISYVAGLCLTHMPLHFLFVHACVPDDCRRLKILTFVESIPSLDYTQLLDKLTTKYGLVEKQAKNFIKYSENFRKDYRSKHNIPTSLQGEK